MIKPTTIVSKELMELEMLLEEYTIEFCWINKKALGKIIPGKGVIQVNLYLLIAETIMHEMMHYLRPNISEVDTELLARAKLGKMTTKEIKEIVETIIQEGGKNEIRKCC